MQATFVQTRLGAAKAPALWYRQLEETHSVDTSKCSTSLCTCNVGRSRISTGFCFQTSLGGAQAPVELTRPGAAVAFVVQTRPGETQAPVCRHVHVQL